MFAVSDQQSHSSRLRSEYQWDGRGALSGICYYRVWFRIMLSDDGSSYRYRYRFAFPPPWVKADFFLYRIGISFPWEHFTRGLGYRGVTAFNVTLFRLTLFRRVGCFMALKLLELKSATNRSPFCTSRIAGGYFWKLELSACRASSWIR